MFSIQLIFAIYLLVLLLIGGYFFATTETKRLSDYMLGGREVGVWPMAISDVASVASGWTFFAWVGIGYTTGLSGLWFSVTMIIVIAFMYRYVASPFRRQSEELGSLTIVDHIAVYFEGERLGSLIRLVATIAVVVFMVSYVGSQIIAVGEAMDTGIGIDYTWAVLVGGLIVGIYTVLGGFNASIWTDVFQGVLIFVAAVTLPVLMVLEIGGWNAFVAEVTATDASLLSMTAGEAGTALLVATLAWISFALGTIGQPQSLMRFQAIDSERIVSAASVITVTFQSLRLTVPLFIGAAGRVLYEGLDPAEAENVAMMAIVDLFPTLIAGILLAAIVSAILSTSDSMLLVTSADVTRFYESAINPDASEHELIVLGRAVVGVVVALGVVIAYTRPGTIFEIIEFAYVGLGVTFGIPLLFILFWERTTPEAVLTGLLVGLTSSIGSLYLLPELDPITPWPVTIGAMLIVSLLTADSTPTSSPAAADD
ncbi:proline permease [Natrialba chahannaoensis JCM 10990]|uniref:Proline permease n=1 Tax=Natrialba chahannaoensis JCM 10990 TaxID=1227492 RepID=M0AGQ1_9EURY|nr:sodium/proline symporter [Natrialba chahannaoensis]ELY97521.1 proline permease [Natrialba chahannaoensis JCM 10990]